MAGIHADREVGGGRGQPGQFPCMRLDKLVTTADLQMLNKWSGEMELFCIFTISPQCHLCSLNDLTHGGQLEANPLCALTLFWTEETTLSLSAIAMHCSDMIHCSAPPPLVKMHLRKTIAGVFPLLSQKPTVAIPKISFSVVGREFGFWGCFSFSNGGLVGVSNGHKALTHVCRWTVIVQQSCTLYTSIFLSFSTLCSMRLTVVRSSSPKPET